MKSSASLSGHPIHPMLIPYPFAFLSGAAAFDVLATARRDQQLARTAQHLTTAGLATALAAAVPGVIDYVATVPSGAARQTATRHLLSNVTALVCFAAAMRMRRRDGVAGGSALALQAAGTVLLSLGGWLGGKLVYHHQIGVTPEARRAEAGHEDLRPPSLQVT
jgi:uncharacterized membrane protein